MGGRRSVAVQQRREREKQQRRQQILSAAKGVFSARGFSGATVEEIASQAELGIGTLYLYFRSKEEIYVSLLLEGMELFSAELERIKASQQSPPDKLRAVWDFFYRYYLTYPEHYKMLMFLHREGIPASISGDVIAEINLRAARNFRLAADIVRDGMDAGTYHRGRPREVVDVLWSLLMGLVQLAETRKNLGLEVGALEELHRKAFAWVEQGLRTPAAAPGPGEARPTAAGPCTAGSP